MLPDDEIARLLRDNARQLPPPWRKVIDATDEGFMIVDAGRRVLFINRRAAEMFGRSPAEVRGVQCSEAIDCPRCEYCCHLFEQEGAGPLDVTVFPPGEREPRVLRTVARVLRDSEGRVLGGVETFSDVTHERSSVPSPASFQGIVSQSPRMREVVDLIECAAHNDANVLIEGESGVGKELVAREIHRLGPRRREPFFAIHCATLSGTLLSSELFGHEPGPFSEASRPCAGKLELVREGTLFLDEVTEIPLQYQALLLRVLEERQFEREGGRRVALRARIIAASSRCLREAVSNGGFRQDLCSRLRAIRIHVPPLRERPEDIPFLVLRFARGRAVGGKNSRVHFTEGAMRALTRHAWPGNVRELRNVVEYLCVVPGRTVDFDSLPDEVVEAAGMAGAAAARAQPSSEARERERAQLLDALRRCNFRKEEAARLLGIDRTTLWRKLRRLGP